jgi:hypothetical protein
MTRKERISLIKSADLHYYSNKYKNETIST